MPDERRRHIVRWCALSVIGAGLAAMVWLAHEPTTHDRQTMGVPLLSHEETGTAKVVVYTRPVPAATPPDAGASAPVLDAPASELPLTETLHESPAVRRKLHHASERAIDACMRRRGLHYVPEPYREDGESAAESDEEAANEQATVGYGLADAKPGAPPPSVNDANVAALSEREREAWYAALRGADRPPPSADDPDDPGLGKVSLPYGPTVFWDRGSCLTDAVRAVHGDEFQYMRLSIKLNALANEVQTRVESDPAYVASLEKWQNCMKDRGFSFERPGEVPEAIMHEHGQKPGARDALRTREVALAELDRACQERAQLEVQRNAAQRNIEQAVAQEHEQDLVAYRRMHSEAIARADQLVADDD